MSLQRHPISNLLDCHARLTDSVIFVFVPYHGTKPFSIMPTRRFFNIIHANQPQRKHFPQENSIKTARISNEE